MPSRTRWTQIVRISTVSLLPYVEQSIPNVLEQPAIVSALSKAFCRKCLINAAAEGKTSIVGTPIERASGQATSPPHLPWIASIRDYL